MQYKTTKDACSDSLLASDETCKGQPTAVTFSDEGQNVQQTVENGNNAEKSPLTDVPLNLGQLAAIYEKDVPPPYNADPAHQAVWSTETSKVHPGRPRIVGRDGRRLTIICRTLLLILAGIVGLYLCFSGFSSLLKNYEIARELELVGDEAHQAVNIIYDLDNIPEEFEGKLVYASGPLTISQPLNYHECHVSVQSVKLKRTFDMDHVFVRGSGVENFASEKWPKTRISKEHFCNAPNPRYEAPLYLRTEEQIAADVRIGPLTLGHRLKEKFGDYYYFITEKLMVMDEFTGFRVMYSDAGRNNETHSVMGQLVNGSIMPYDLLDYYTIILHREHKVTAADMIDDRVNCRLGKLAAENWWSYMEVGLGILIPLTVMLHYAAVIRAMKKNKRNHVMLSMPVQ